MYHRDREAVAVFFFFFFSLFFCLLHFCSFTCFRKPSVVLCTVVAGCQRCPLGGASFLAPFLEQAHPLAPAVGAPQVASAR